MQNIIREAPEVAEAFFKMTKAIDQQSPYDLKTKELMLVGIFTAHNAVRGIKTHVERALENGASQKEIIWVILYALPVVGISSITAAIKAALEVIEEKKPVSVANNT